MSKNIFCLVSAANSDLSTVLTKLLLNLLYFSNRILNFKFAAFFKSIQLPHCLVEKSSEFQIIWYKSFILLKLLQTVVWSRKKANLDCFLLKIHNPYHIPPLLQTPLRQIKSLLLHSLSSSQVILTHFSLSHSSP